VKITLHPTQARKLLRVLDHTTDPDLKELTDKVEQALQPGLMLTGDELTAVLQQLHAVALPAGAQLDTIARAIPKLEVLHQKTLIREGIEAAAQRRPGGRR
jgi:hypothetical protein